MAEYGLDDSGFKTKPFAEIRDDIKSRLMQVYDPSSMETLQPDFNEDDPFIQMVNAFCDELAALWQIAFAAYGQFNPLVASGVSLSGLVQLNGIVRQQGVPATVMLTFTGENGVFVPRGTLATDVDKSVEWATTEDIQIEDGSAAVKAESVVNGIFSYGAGTINTLVNEITGVTSVVNESASVPGAFDESDEALRIRRSRSTEAPSRGIAESIEGAISNLAGVSYCKIFCNRSLETDSYGIPAKSVALVALGGDDEAIAKELFNRAGVVTGFFGTTTISYKDSLGIVTPVSFSRPISVYIDVDVVVTSIEGSQYPLDFTQRIKDAIIAFAERGVSGLGITAVDSFDNFGFPPSEDIVASRLYTAVNSVQGLRIISLKIAKHGQTLGVANIPIAWNEVGVFLPANINVEMQQ